MHTHTCVSAPAGSPSRNSCTCALRMALSTASPTAASVPTPGMTPGPASPYAMFSLMVPLNSVGSYARAAAPRKHYTRTTTLMPTAVQTCLGHNCHLPPQRVNITGTCRARKQKS